MTICFVANYSKTYLFHGIAERLREQNGIDVCWIVVNKKLYQFLSSLYDRSKILYLNKSFANAPGSPVDEFSVNEIVYGDRALRHDMAQSQKLMVNIQRPIFEFAINNKVSAFFGEHTWGHELIVARIARSMNIPFLDPQVVRIPNGRFGFFRGESHEELYEIKPTTHLNGTEIFKVHRPEYVKINNDILKDQRSLKGRIDKARRFFTNENIDRDDPTMISDQRTRFKLRTQIEINKEAYYFVKRYSYNEVIETPYVFHTLHMQPESTIDVFGRYYEDQFQMVVNLWRKLPLGWKLVIKEHTNAIGDRPLSFYKKIQKLPNVLFVDEKVHSHDLIKSAQLVVTVAGTVAYEAALLGVPAVIFSRAYFCQLSGCLYKTLRELADCNSLADWVTEANQGPDNRREFCQFIMNNSFEGIMTDPVSNPAVMNDDNIEKLANAFAAVITKIK